MAIKRINESLAYNDAAKTLYLKNRFLYVGGVENDTEYGRQVDSVFYGGEILKLDLSQTKARLRGPRGSIPFSFRKSDAVVIGVGAQPNVMKLGESFTPRGEGLTPQMGFIRYLEGAEPDTTVATYISRILQNAADQAKISMGYTYDRNRDIQRLEEAGLADGRLLTQKELCSVYGSPEQKKVIAPMWHEAVPDLTHMLADEEEFAEKFPLLQSWHPRDISDSLHLANADVNDLHVSIYRDGNDKILLGCHCGKAHTRIRSGLLETSLRFSDIPTPSSFGREVRREMESYLAMPSHPVSFAARYKIGCSIPYSDSSYLEDEAAYLHCISLADNRARKLGWEMKPLPEEGLSVPEAPKDAYQRALQAQEGMPTEYDCAEHLDWFTAEKDAKAVKTMLDKGYDETVCKETVEKCSPSAALNLLRDNAIDREFLPRLTQKYLATVRYSDRVMDMAKHPNRAKDAAR